MKGRVTTIKYKIMQNDQIHPMMKHFYYASCGHFQCFSVFHKDTLNGLMNMKICTSYAMASTVTRLSLNPTEHLWEILD